MENRKTALELFKECKEIEFKSGHRNYYIFRNSTRFKIDFNYHLSALITRKERITNINTEFNKYISKEDAEYIVINCIENNGGLENEGK